MNRATVILGAALSVLSFLVCHAEELPVTPPPYWSVPSISAAPKIDGRINESEWKGAACITGYQLFPSVERGFCPLQTWAFAAWDSEYLYLAFRSPHTYRDIILINVRGRDAAAYTDESYEVDLWADNAETSYSFIVGLASLYDAKSEDPNWNSAGIKYEISQHDSFFDAEMAIPWKDMETSPKAGMELKTVLAHTSMENGKVMSNWHYCGASYHDKKLAGSLVLTDDAASVRMLDWGPINRGFARPILELANTTKASVKLSYKLFVGTRIDQPDGRYLATGSLDLPAGETGRIAPQWPVLNPDLRAARIVVSQGEKKLADFALPFKFTQEVRATVKCYPSKQKLNVTVDAESVLATGKVGSIRVSLRKAGKAIFTTTAPAGKSAQANVTFDFSKLKLGDYTILSEAIAPDGSVVTSAENTWTKIEPKPDWMVHPVAAQRRVPKPFTPVVVNKASDGSTQVAMWGRVYSFRDSLYPIQVESQGRKMLASPAGLTGSIGGKSFDASKAKVEIVEKSADRVVLSAVTKANGVIIKTRTQVEFDGMLLSTLTLTPETPNATIQSLKFEMPFDNKAAALMHYNDCNVSAATWSGDTPAEWSGAYHPVIWLGNEYAGLCWFAESTNGWSNTDTNKQIALSTTENRTVFTLNFIDKPITLKKPLKITFGFTATPTKPMPQGWLVDQNVGLDPWWDESNQFLHEAIPYDVWRAKADAIHKGGWKMLKYTQTNYLSFYGDLTPEDVEAQKRPGSHYYDTPEKKFWQNDWEVWPSNNMGGKANALCTKTAWADLVVAGLKERMVNGGVDGIYFDCAMPHLCNSPIHGCDCGYDLLGQRDIRRRLCNISDDLGKDGIIYEHISDNMLGPLMSFPTYHYDGEQFSGGVKDYRQKLSLARMRAFSIGTNWGHIPDFMIFVDYGDDVAVGSLMATWSLHMPWHDVKGYVTPSGHSARLLDNHFGFSNDTKRLGYWENGDIVGGQGEKLKSTVYYKPGSMLLVVSNLGDDAVNTSLTLNTAKIGFDPMKLKLAEWVDNQSAKPYLSDGKLNLVIKANSCVMCILN